MANPLIWTPDKIRLAMALTLERALMDYMNPNFYIKRKKEALEYNPEEFFYEKVDENYTKEHPLNFVNICDILHLSRKRFLFAVEAFRMKGITYEDLLKKAHERRKRKGKKRKGIGIRVRKKYGAELMELYEILLKEGRVMSTEYFKARRIRGKVDLNKVKKIVREREEFDKNQKKEMKSKGIIKYEAIYNSKTDKLADLILMFGRWAGYRISELCEFPEGLNYITRFILNPDNDFDDEFRELVQRVMHKYNDGRRSSYSHGDDRDIPY